MKIDTRGLIILISVTLLSCNDLYAQMISDKVVEDFLSIKSYRAEVREKGIFPDNPDTERVTAIVFKKPFNTRAEVLAPEKNSGEIFQYVDDAITMWWPRFLFGVKIKGAKPPTKNEIKQSLDADIKWSWENYGYRYLGENSIAGRGATIWTGRPYKNMPYYFAYSTWADKQFSIPLKVVIKDKPDHLWYSMEFGKIDFDAQVEDEQFEFQFPPNAVVFEWDLSAPGLPIDDIKKYMNFPLLIPKSLPKNINLEKIIRSNHCLPMAAVIMSGEGKIISLTESRSLGIELTPEVGIPVMIGKNTGYLNFMGAYVSIFWTQGITSMMLVGNLPFQKMIKIAESVE